MESIISLANKLEEVTIGGGGFGDMYIFLQRFFDRSDVREAMVRLNQEMHYEHGAWSDGVEKQTYSPYSLLEREDKGLYTSPSEQWLAHFNGALFRSMGLHIGSDYVEITAGTNNPDAIGYDAYPDNPYPDEPGHIEAYFRMYDPERYTLGLRDEDFQEQIVPLMIDSLITQLKDYLNG